MPLGERLDYEDARFSGLAVVSCERITDHLDVVCKLGGFDFLAVPLANRLEPRTPGSDGRYLIEFARPDMIPTDSETPRARLLGLVSPWIDPGSSDADIRTASRQSFKAEVEWAKYLGLQAVALPAPHTFSSPAAYAQVLNSLLASCPSLGMWIRINMSSDPVTNAATWRWWDTIRTLCCYNASMGVLLEIKGPNDMTPELMDSRWLGEPVRGAFVHTSAFLKNKRQFPVLPRPLQAVVSQIFKLGQQVSLLINGPVGSLEPASGATETSPTPSESASYPLISSQSRSFSNASATPLPSVAPQSLFNPRSATDVIRAHYEYLGFLFSKLPPLSGLGASEFAYRDHLQLPLQPLADDLENSVYATFERDRPKYEHYQEAVRQALHDVKFTMTASSSGAMGAASHNVIVVAVLGAGRGPLVEATLAAADAVDAAVMVMAVEKNANAVAVLQARLTEPRWAERVVVVPADMRSLTTDMQADIMVSELLGSFGDNELSPECLDGAKDLLKPGGICIPSSYTSFLAPVTAHTVYSAIQHMKRPERLEMPMVVRLWKHIVLAAPQPAFTFVHPRETDSIDNSRELTLQFALHHTLLPSTIHGFAGYFEAVLYKGVRLSTLPSTHTQDMHSWFPIFFPLIQPIRLEPGCNVSVAISRFATPAKVWYEWAMLEPSPSKVHNTNGHAYSINLLKG